MKRVLYIAMLMLFSLAGFAQKGGKGGGNGGGSGSGGSGGGGGNGANANGQFGSTYYQNFNQSVNQIGDCWQMENMKITTKNTIFNANQKKALVGTNTDGDPAYTFTSPLFYFNGTGKIEFYHKLTVADGIYRELELVLIDKSDKVVQTVFNHVYIDSLGNYPNGNPTTPVLSSISVNWTGEYRLQWRVTSWGGTGFAMFDNIVVDAMDVSDASNDNGYGYCKPDDVIYDTICAGSLYQHDVPYAIAQSDWTWTWLSGAGGTIDSTLVAGPVDTSIYVQWAYTASGDYILEATEIRPPYNTTTYSVEMRIHVLPVPEVTLALDSVCPGAMHTASFGFTGSDGPWTVTFTDGDSTYTQTFTDSLSTFSMGLYNTATQVQILSVVGANGCPADTTNLPSATAGILAGPATGPIWHY